MTIPEGIQDKLDSNPSWAVQHEDIVRVMDETPKGKPWSRYMIQQHLDGSPAKKTVQDRLDELAELDVLDKYEYTNQTLYDLAYDPIVTDGGRLKDANLIELVTLRDQTGLRDLAAGAIFTSLSFIGIAILTWITGLPNQIDMTGNFYFDAGILLYAFGGILILLVWITQKVDLLLPVQEAP